MDHIRVWWNSLFIRSEYKKPLLQPQVYPQPIPGLLDVWKRPDVKEAIAKQNYIRSLQVHPSGPEMK